MLTDQSGRFCWQLLSSKSAVTLMMWAPPSSTVWFCCGDRKQSWLHPSVLHWWCYLHVTRKKTWSIYYISSVRWANRRGSVVVKQFTASSKGDSHAVGPGELLGCSGSLVTAGTRHCGRKRKADCVALRYTWRSRWFASSDKEVMEGKGALNSKLLSRVICVWLHSGQHQGCVFTQSQLFPHAVHTATMLFQENVRGTYCCDGLSCIHSSCIPGETGRDKPSGASGQHIHRGALLHFHGAHAGSAAATQTHLTWSQSTEPTFQNPAGSWKKKQWERNKC